jgi:hypothetical protein
MKAQTIAAAGLLFALGTHAQSAIDSGTGFGTYYYDVEQVDACSNDFSAQNSGPVECGLSTALPLTQIDSNYLVAMNHSQLVDDMSLYCGKKVVVSVNGVASDLPLFIGDGCQRCGTGSSSSDVWDPNGAPGLDFSYSVLSELSSSACADGHISITWEIMDETLFDFDTNAPGSQEGPVGGSDSTSASPTTATPATSAPAPPPASTSAPEPAPATAPASTSTSTSTSTSPSTSTVDQTPSAAPSSSPSQTPTSQDSAVPSTLVTVHHAATVSPMSTGTPTDSSASSTAPSPTTSDPSGPCPTGAWQCNANADTLQQCLDGSWTARIVCPTGLACQGGNSPYCAPPGYE